MSSVCRVLLTDSNYPPAEQQASDQQIEHGKGSTPLIVGLVVGLVAGLTLFALGIWWFLRKRSRRQQEVDALAPDPYPVGRHDTARFRKGDLPEDSIPAPASPVHSAVGDSDDSLDEPVGRLGQDETGSELVEFLPPQYRDDWQAEPAAPQQFEAGSRPLSSSPASPESSDTPQPTTLVPALKDEYRVLIPDRPPLKQEYARAFDAIRSSTVSSAAPQKE